MLFVDVRGFTTLAQQWSPPELVSALNSFFQRATDIFLRHDACIDKLMGDQIMAVFGAPIARPDHAQQALEAALEIQQSAGKLVQAGRLAHELSLGAAIHTGQVVVGNIGSSAVRDFTVLGDTVNLAAHLQQHAAPGEVLVTEATEAALSAPLQNASTRDVQVKGRETPIRVKVVRSSAS